MKRFKNLTFTAKNKKRTKYSIYLNVININCYNNQKCCQILMKRTRTIY